jgi:5'-nucleotidase
MRLACLIGAACLLPGLVFARAPTCTTADARPTVVLGSTDSGVPNRTLAGGCSINDLILDELDWKSHGAFVKHVAAIADDLRRQGIVSGAERGRIMRAAGQSWVGHTIGVQVLAINDFHGQLKPPAAGGGRIAGIDAGGAEYLATYVAALRATNPNSVVVSAGDLIGASPLLSALFHDEPTIEAMNLIGLDLNAVGNHEFDEGAQELLRMQAGGCHPVDGCQDGDGFGGAKFRFLAANVVSESTGETLFPPVLIKRFTHPRHGGETKVAFIGMTLEATPLIVTPSGVAGLRFLDEADTANALVPKLRGQGIEAIVVVVHEGGFPTGAYNDCPGISGPIVDIVERLDPAIDVVITGHTHQAYNCVIDGRLVTSAASVGRLVTDIDLTLDTRTKDVVRTRAQNVIVTRTVAPEPQITTLIAKYEALAAPLENRPIGRIAATLSRTANAAGESALGNVIADAQLAATAPAQFGGAQIAFMNPGGVRADLDFPSSAAGEGDGVVTYGEAFTVQPFGNSLVTLTLTGAQIATLLEQQFVGCPNGQRFNRILHPSRGFSYAWNALGPDCDKVDPASIRLNGIAVLPQQRYRVTVNSFLADGGDLFGVLTAGSERLGGAQDIDALEAWLRDNPELAPPALNRILRIN